ncbi:MAG: SdrD B-like domain-containing protein, partial [Bacteroidia bacterium]
MKKIQVMGEIKARSQRWLVMASLLLMVVVAVACEKEPGKGGLATISGKVWGRDINANGFLHDSGYAGAVKVYISYGDHEWVDASETTSPTGDYAFQGLQKGDYRIFV